MVSAVYCLLVGLMVLLLSLDYGSGWGFDVVFDSLHGFGVGLLAVGCLSVVSLWFMVCLSSLVFVVSFLGFDLLLILAV